MAIGTGKDGKRQVVDVLIDTGSFELWVDPVCSASNVPDFCNAFGRYDPALSTTSRKVGDRRFTIKYGSGQATGDYYKDDIYISGELNQVPFLFRFWDEGQGVVRGLYSRSGLVSPELIHGRIPRRRWELEVLPLPLEFPREREKRWANTSFSSRRRTNRTSCKQARRSETSSSA